MERPTDGAYVIGDQMAALAQRTAASADALGRALDFARLLAAEQATGALRKPRQSAGYRPDVIDERQIATDAMNVAADVQALCELITSVDAVPPISIGLFGPWGSGKSFFMRLMRQDIKARSKRLANSPDTFFCRRVKQIVFNAWHYADADLWASLITHLLEELAVPPNLDSDELSAAERSVGRAPAGADDRPPSRLRRRPFVDPGTLRDWLTQHPGVEIVCRDRAGAYAEGARAGARNAVQVADRWHMWHDLGDAVERTVTHHACLREPIVEDDQPAVVPAVDAAPVEQGRLVGRTEHRYAAIQERLAAGCTPSAPPARHPTRLPPRPRSARSSA